MAQQIASNTNWAQRFAKRAKAPFYRFTADFGDMMSGTKEETAKDADQKSAKTIPVTTNELPCFIPMDPDAALLMGRPWNPIPTNLANPSNTTDRNQLHGPSSSYASDPMADTVELQPVVAIDLEPMPEPPSGVTSGPARSWCDPASTP